MDSFHMKRGRNEDEGEAKECLDIDVDDWAVTQPAKVITKAFTRFDLEACYKQVVGYKKGDNLQSLVNGVHRVYNMLADTQFKEECDAVYLTVALVRIHLEFDFCEAYDAAISNIAKDDRQAEGVQAIMQGYYLMGATKQDVQRPYIGALTHMDAQIKDITKLVVYLQTMIPELVDHIVMHTRSLFTTMGRSYPHDGILIKFMEAYFTAMCSFACPDNNAKRELLHTITTFPALSELNSMPFFLFTCRLRDGLRPTQTPTSTDDDTEMLH